MFFEDVLGTLHNSIKIDRIAKQRDRIVAPCIGRDAVIVLADVSVMNIVPDSVAIITDSAFDVLKCSIRRNDTIVSICMDECESLKLYREAEKFTCEVRNRGGMWREIAQTKQFIPACILSLTLCR